MNLSRRALYIPVNVSTRRLKQRVFAVANLLYRGDAERAGQLIEKLEVTLEQHTGRVRQPLKRLEEKRKRLVSLTDELEQSQERAFLVILSGAAQESADQEKHAALLRLISLLVARLEERQSEVEDQIEQHTQTLIELQRELNPLYRARALCHLLWDLHELGWEVSVEAGRVFVVAPPEPEHGASLRPHEIIAEKKRQRRAVLPRILEQLSTNEGVRLVRTAERRGIQRLFADGPSLAASLSAHGPGAIQPYLQVARGESGVDETTGLRLHTIYRYLRHTWSLPYGDTPGRRLPILIRDAGQLGHPICGLLCLSSPVPRLTARDSRLGLTPGWLEAIVAALQVRPLPSEPYSTLKRRLHEHIQDLCASAESQSTASKQTPSTAVLLRDLSEQLGVKPATDPGKLARRLARLGAAALRQRLLAALSAVSAQLLAEVQGAVENFSFNGLSMSCPQALASPEAWLGELQSIGKAAEDTRAALLSRLQEQRSIGAPDTGLREQARQKLFEKKRAFQLGELLRAWAARAPLPAALAAPEERRLEALQDALAQQVGLPDRGLSGSTGSSRFIREAMNQRRTRLMAAEVVDVSLCGALPPYQNLLGGKLAGLLALSREAAELYFDAYSSQVSLIQTEHAGEAFCRPADLIAMSTTSLYGVGSAQYNRLRLPEDLGGARWEQVGHSSGFGTLQFSKKTTAAFSDLMISETGRREINSVFGEGPSPKLRKIREGLKLLGLPETGLLRHGMSRLVYVAELSAGARPGTAAPPAGYRERGPTTEQIAAHWQARWLAPRLGHNAERLASVRDFSPEQALLSRRYRDDLGDIFDGSDDT